MFKWALPIIFILIILIAVSITTCDVLPGMLRWSMN